MGLRGRRHRLHPGGGSEAGLHACRDGTNARGGRGSRISRRGRPARGDGRACHGQPAPGSRRDRGRPPASTCSTPDDPAAWDRNIAAIREATANADFVIAYQHYQVDAGEGWQESWARATVDAGADLYISHGEPRLAGVEAYGGGLILYGLGNFIFHSRTEIGNYPPETWQSVVATLTIGRDGVGEAAFTPILLDEGSEGEFFLERRGYPEVATGDLGQSILERLAALSADYGTRLDVRDGRARWTAPGR